MESFQDESSDEQMSRYENPKDQNRKYNGYPNRGLLIPSDKCDNVYRNSIENAYTSSVESSDGICGDRQNPRFFGNSIPLSIHSRHMIEVSAIEEGPLVFSVQLMDLKNDLELLMMEINNSRKLPFNEIPNNGCVCLGKKSSDGLLYRSVIMGLENTNSIKLYHVDYGTTELVPFCDIFQIETKFLHDKVYSNRFALQGLSAKPNLMIEIKDLFSKIVADQVLELEVVPPEGPPIVQYCNLYIHGNNVIDKMSDIMKKSYDLPSEIGNLGYEDINISIGGRHDIVVSYIESVKHFYVHLLVNKDKLDEIMNQLYIYCQSAPTLSYSNLEINMACAALYTEDQIWYRALVVSINREFITVRYIDYGNCENVEVTSLKYLPPELIMALEAQAICCSLTGLESLIQSENTTTQLEMLCLEKTLAMTVMDFNHITNSASVDLVDNTICPPLNVSKRIIELSTPRVVRSSISNAEGALCGKMDVTENGVKTRSKSHPEQTVTTFKSQICSHINRNFIKQVDCIERNKLTIALSYKTMDVPEKQQVLVSWFINPLHFYCQLLNKQSSLTEMMRNVQKHYAKEKHDIFEPTLYSPVIVKYQQDSIFYRGSIIEKKSNKYVIDFVDYGFKNVVGLEDLYPIREQFLEHPKMAIRCKIQNILPNRVKSNNISQAWDLFKKEKYDCTFYSKGQNDSMLVDIIFDGESISTQLIEKRFAIKAEEVIKEVIEFPLLCGQTIRCRILGIVDFKKFFVRLQGTASQIECSLYNWTNESTAEIAKLKKKFCDMVQEQDIIIYINDVQKSKLFVTLYDALGNKMQCFSKDDLYPIISPLCPKTILNSDMSVYISHVESNRVFIQDEKDKSLIYDLLEELYTFYEQEGRNVLPRPFGGCLCAAKSSLDKNWYRAVITQISDEGGVMVKYIDYGNSELLQIEDIRELYLDFYVMNELCLETIVYDDSKYDSESTEQVDINLSLIEEGWKITLKNPISDQNIPGSNVNPELEMSRHDTGYITTCSVSTDVLSPMGDHVVIAHIDSPGQFWIQYQNCLDDLHLMHTSLQNVAEKLPSLTNLQVGEKCIARYSIDNQWYRAEVLDADDDITTVRFIDYGNTDVIDNLDNIIKEIDGDLRTAPPYAKKCSLMAVPVHGEEWNEEACQEFDKFANISDSFIVDIVAENERCCYVNLITGDENICSKLLLKKYAVAIVDVNEETSTSPPCIDSDVTTQKKRGYVSHIDSLSDFYVQLECDRAGLEYLEEAFENAASFPPIKEPVEDMVCVAQFSEDNHWYRAAINKELDGGFEVFFIDFGNTAIASEIRLLPDCVNNIGQLAKQCSLLVPANSNLNSDAVKKLQELAADGATIFEIEFVTLNPPYTVQLYLNGEDILSSIC